MNVAVVGLGRIGLPTASLCVQRGHSVVGVDPDPDVRACIEFRDMPYDEPGLELRGFHAVADLAGAGEAEVWIVAVPTNIAGRLDAQIVESVVDQIAEIGAELVVIESTVPPGTCAALARRTGLEIAFCPERARPGQVLHDIGAMPRLVGGVSDAATARAMAFYETLTRADLEPCTAAEAELAKLAENAEREIRIAFANELADASVAAQVDPERVAQLANTHPRASILRHGVGVGGACLPIATRWFAEQADGVAAAARALHERRPLEIARRIAAQVPAGGHVCVLGRTYRANTRYHQPAHGRDPYGSPATELIEHLRAMGLRVTSWDPSDDEDRATAEHGADLVYVAVPHAEFDAS